MTQKFKQSKKTELGKSASLKKLHRFFANTPRDIRYLSEEEIAKMIRKEIKLFRKAKEGMHH